MALNTEGPEPEAGSPGAVPGASPGVEPAGRGRSPLADLRRSYGRGSLGDEALRLDPLALLCEWFDAASRQCLEPTAAALATGGRDGPDVRMVLIKEAGPSGVVFYTNLASAKAEQLAADRRAALCCHWPELERQLRLRGHVERVGVAAATRYFQSRPLGSQVAAWASPQSRPVASREALERLVQETRERFGAGGPGAGPLPLPPHWGGFRLRPAAIEFWQGGPDRLHDRLLFRRQSGGWRAERLAP